MTPAELAAYIGAAAWIPQIITWMYKAFVVPRILINLDRYAEVGFTSVFGPIFHVRMALSSDRMPAILDGFEIVLKHADGETQNFRWAGLQETFSEIRDNAGNMQTVGRDQTPIAMKVAWRFRSVPPMAGLCR